MKEANGILCGPRIYEFNGWVFEFGPCGPWPLKEDGELRKRCGRKFLDDIQPFCMMDKITKENYRVGGGCRSF